MSNAASFPGGTAAGEAGGAGDRPHCRTGRAEPWSSGGGWSCPGHLPEDLRRFKRLTLGHPLVMGRRTFESLLHQFGGPLPGRRNVVVSTGAAWPQYPEVEVYRSLREALAALEDEPRIFIGGGGTVYAQCLPLADRLGADAGCGGTTPAMPFFPPLRAPCRPGPFEKVAEDRRSGFRFVTYRRRDAAGPACVSAGVEPHVPEQRAAAHPPREACLLHQGHRRRRAGAGRCGTESGGAGRRRSPAGRPMRVSRCSAGKDEAVHLPCLRGRAGHEGLHVVS
ncbi:MAG: hypothetical protein KatS3mg044_0991 [Rhodothermaceae bacterium]|nr:MAG: hypothetical protein KatS3mg044_0991 [Rhodothermaceae bacterium]